MEEEIELIVVLAQKSRHIVETCGMKQRRISPTERDHVGAAKKDVQHILPRQQCASLAKTTVYVLGIPHQL